MARAIEVPVVVKRGTLARSIEGEASTAFRKLGASSGAVAPLGRMFGKITADADEFTKSIEASNARVLAFGASVAVINGVANAFKQLVAVTVNVEKSLTDINVVLNASQADLSKFGDGLFKVAKNTAQSFDVVAEAATEFARQGLTIQETLKRTNDALILTRLTGLKAADSVKGLTAATNGFAKAGLTTTQIINKLAAVDVKFAVSADDLIAALSRTGAVAQDAGMNMDELIGMVTAAQQVTARGGPVIGNAFKTIFTRVQRPETLKTLRELKIAVDDASGAALPASKVLQNLATSYDGLSRSAKDAVNQQVAGVFQINILKAAVGDLQKQNSIAARATAVSAGATDQATQKNQMLNQTIAALTSQTGLALEELAKKIGDIALAPGMRDLITSLKGIVEGTTGVLDGEGTGSKFAQGLLKGIGNVLTGPGLIVIGGVFMKLFKDLAVFGMNSLKNLLGLNKAAQQQALLQKGIGQYLAGNVAYEQQMAAAAGNLNKQAAITQQFLAREIAMRQTAANLSAQMAAGAFAGGFRVSKAGDLTRKGKGKIPGFAPTGGVPNFASIIDGPGNGKTYDVGRLPASITGGGSFNEPMTISRFLKLSKLKSRSAAGGMTPLGGAMREFFDSQGITHITGQAGKAHIPFSGPKDARSFYQDVFSKPGPQGMNTSAIYERGLSLMKGKNSAFANDPVGAFYHAVNEAHPAPPGKSTNPTAVSIRGHFARGAFESEAIKRMGAQGFSHSNFIVDAARGGKPMEVKARMTESTRASILGKQFKMDQDVYSKAPAYLKAALDENIDRIHSRTKVQQLSSIPGSLEEKTFGRGVGRMAFRGKLRGFASNYAPNFSPIGEAIQREKLQVGAMMGISPSSVKTRVVQNTALRSSFNPGGFGVISPTVGQNSFGDAARMHRGQDLRTVNLAPSLPVPGIDPMRPALSMTPTGYSDVIKTTIHGVTPEAGKLLGSSIGKGIASEAKKLTPPKPMARGITIPRSSVAVPAPAAPGGGFGGAAMNAFMGYSMGTMVDPLAQDFLGTSAGVMPAAIGGGMLGHAGGKALGRRLGMRTLGIPGALIGGTVSALGAGYMSDDAKFLRNQGFEQGRGAGDRVLDPISNALDSAMTGLFDILLPGADAITGNAPPENPTQAGTTAERAKIARELFRSQINQQRDLQLDTLSRRNVGAQNATRAAELQQARSRGRLGISARSGGLSALDVARRTSTINRSARGASNRAALQEFISQQGSGLISQAGGFGFEGGGAQELRIRNLMRENIAQGNFGAVDTFFSNIRQGKGNVQDLRSPLGMRSGFTDPREMAGIEERGLSLNQGPSEAEAMDAMEQSKNFDAFSVSVKKTAESFAELKKQMDFADKMAEINEEMAETAAAMQNVNRFTSGFSSSFAGAFSSITTGASSAKNAMMDFGINVFGTINKIQSERIGQMLTGAIFPEGGKGQGFLKSIFGGGKQRGGIIEAQNGMYISGGRTGDKNPAMLEDGEYVLNRNAVKAMGGPGALDSINFNMAPRFSRGGRLLSPISHSGVPKKSLNKILAEYEAPATLTDPRLSGFAHANDPTLQNVRGDIREYHNKQIQKKFESQAKKDQLMQTIVGAVVQTGIAQGMDFAKTKFQDAKLAKQQDFTSGIMGIDTGPGFIGPMNQPSGAGAGAGGVGFDSAAIAKNFGAAMDPARGFAAPGFNMTAGASSGPQFGPGQQMGMMIRPGTETKEQRSAQRGMDSRAKALITAKRLKRGDKFARAVSAYQGDHGGHAAAMMKTLRGQGIKSGDRVGMSNYFRGIADAIGGEFGIIPPAKVKEQFEFLSTDSPLAQPTSVTADPTGLGRSGAAVLGAPLQRNVRGQGDSKVLPFIDNRDLEFKKTPKKIRKDKNGNVIIEYQRGGHIDNIPAMLTGGEFVMNASAVRRHGSGFFNKLNRGGRIGYQQGGLVGDQSFVQGENGVTQQSNTSESTSNNTTINITVNSGGGEASVSTEGQPASKEKEMAMKIRGAVLSVIKEEKRTGGTLRDVTSET